MGSALIRIFERPFYRKLHQPGEIGTTSACAENTSLSPPPRPLPGNYLRVRGEYYQYKQRHMGEGELPPRARRILTSSDRSKTHGGTTSACAENTEANKQMYDQFGNYLRVRGEYTVQIKTAGTKRELPPRARRIPGRPHLQHRIPGTTSAHAENTILRR